MKSNLYSLLMIFGFALLTLLSAETVHAYPDFISYGYKSCVSCHYSGGGGGQLNDYGRALFASEFSATTFRDKKPDQLANESGFLGSTELPWWIRPGFKYRGLWFRTNVGSPNQKDRIIHMQGDLDLTLHFDKDNKFVFVSNYGYVPKKQNSSNSEISQWTSRQHYLRWNPADQWIFYAGLMDKFYGIRHADHTAVNRSLISLGQTDQSHGVAVQFLTDKYEISGGLFAGNYSQESEIRSKGFSGLFEYSLEEKITFGISALNQANNFVDESRLAMTSRIGFGKGRSLMAEIGSYKNKGKLNYIVNDEDGYYLFLQSLVLINKGYNYLFSYQNYKPSLTESSKEVTKLALGFLFFPIQRTEIRTEIVNLRTVAQQNTSPDSWNLQTQLHISW